MAYRVVQSLGSKPTKAPNKLIHNTVVFKMEIITYILQGSLEHKDSLGTGSIIQPGEVQRLSAGTGIRHSEFNPSATDQVHLLQIWLLPDTQDLPPSYEQKSFNF